MSSLRYLLIPSILYFSPVQSVALSAEINGVIKLAMQGRTSASPDLSRLASTPQGSASLCSPDRVYLVIADQQGRFRFMSIVPGSYQLIAAATSAYPPAFVRNIEVIAEGQVVDPVTAIVYPGRETNPCYVTTDGSNLLMDYEVTYGPLVQDASQGRIEGKILGTGSGRVHMEGRSLNRAEITISPANSKGRDIVLKSSNKGTFISDIEPGIYILHASYPGYHYIDVEPFLVPRQNVTKVWLRAAPKSNFTISR